MSNPSKRCLYEILNLPRDCSPDEIRSSYRRLALQLHPDKNPSASPAAFQELQHAYEVLSDPKERQFYDSHRSQILFSSSNSSSKPSSSFFDLDLFSYFSTTAFSGFSDTGKGFFKVYADVFGKIYSQELFFAKELGLDPDSVRPAPLIGNLESPYSQVTAFYNYWLGFVTVLDFAWVDEYEVTLGVNRRSRRAMEEENKKKRKKARREYNDLVRDLAAFVKKRDKRVKDMQVKKSLEEEKRREEEKKRKKEEERRKLERARMYEEQEWARIDEEEVSVEDVDDEEEEEKGKKKEEFYCVVCNKKFKSEKQWKNHEQSKKHKEKVAELRVTFQEEEEEEEEEEDFKSVDDGEALKFEDNVMVDDELAEEFKQDLGLKEGEAEDVNLDRGDESLGSDDEESMLEAMISGRKSMKSSYIGRDDFVSNQDGYNSNEEERSMEHDFRKGQRNRAATRGADADDDSEVSRDETCGSAKSETEVVNLEKSKEAEIRSEFGTIDDADEESVTGTKEETDAEASKEASPSFEGVAAKGKRNQAAGKKHEKQQVDPKGSAKKEANTKASSSKGKKQRANARAPNNSCQTCGESFDSRTKLFKHLGDSGHAALKSR